MSASVAESQIDKTILEQPAWKVFFRLEKSKLIFLFGLLYVFINPVLLFLFYDQLFNGDAVAPVYVVSLFVGVGLGFPFFLVGLATLRGIWDVQKRKNAFSTPPFLELLHHNFTLELLHVHNRWRFSEPIMRGRIQEYELEVSIDTQNAPYILRFLVLVPPQKLDKLTIHRLTRLFAQKNMELDKKGITKKIHTKKHRLRGFRELQKELTMTLELLRNEGFVPQG